MRGFFGRRAVRVVGVIALLVVVVVSLFLILNWYVAPTKPGERKDLVLALAQILGGTALLSGLYFTWRTLQVNREGQITERFTRAIDQLGKVDGQGKRLFEIRIGGIYALGRIARESEEDHWPIMEVLTAYVRQHAPRRLEGRGQEGEEATAVELKSVEDSSGESEATEAPTPDPDIRAIMSVLRRRTRYFGHGEPEALDLHETNLSGANLSGAHLFEADLSNADLSGANLSGADLSGMSLFGASDVGVGAANLSGANLSRADLSRADLSEAQLEKTIGDEHTKLPPHLEPPAHWGVKTDEQPEED